MRSVFAVSPVQSNVLVTEYLFNMLPSYIFIVAAAFRTWHLKNEQTGSKSKCHESFDVKVRLCYWMSVSYVVAIGLAFLVPSGMFWQADSPLYSLIYILALLSWTQSARLLTTENALLREQEVWTHKIFWSFSFSLTLVRMF